MVNLVVDSAFQTDTGKSVVIRDVWASNIEEEFANIRKLVAEYPVIAMDTEFPGIVAQPIGEFNSIDVPYQRLRCNVNLLKLIQLGLTLTDESGNFVAGCTCWQFNFKFSLRDDLYAQDSIELLKSSGIDFDKFQEQGVDCHRFAELLMMSGLVLNDDVKWLTFHSSYDFGYLLKTLTGDDLPTDENGFIDLLHTYFPNVYDIKYMMANIEGLYGGLSTLAELLDVPRIGPMHQAGSDSLLTSQTFFKLVNRYFKPGGAAGSSGSLRTTSSSPFISRARPTPPIEDTPTKEKEKTEKSSMEDKDKESTTTTTNTSKDDIASKIGSRPSSAKPTGDTKSSSAAAKLNVFENNKAIEKYVGELFGLGNSKNNANVQAMMKRSLAASMPTAASNPNFHSTHTSGTILA